VWILNFIPDVILQAIIHGLFVLSLVCIIASYFISNIPQIGAYSTIIRIASVVVFIVCVFIEGMFYKDAQWEERVAELKQKVELAEQASKEVNTVIEYKYKDRVKKVTEFQVVVEEKIKLVENKINAECKIAPEVISILNEAAKQ
jgi:hypothetical protein